MTVFELILIISKYPIQKAESYLESLKSLSNAEFLAWQNNKREEILKYHLQNNPFYQQFTGINKHVKWEEIPILTKKDIRLPIQDLISSEFALKDLRVSTTSGSTGTPLFFAKDRFAHAMTWAVIKDRYSWYGINFSSNQARFYGIPLTRFHYYKERFKDFFMNRFRFVVFDLSEYSLNSFEHKFRQRKFDFVYGYTNSMVVFAKHLTQKGLVLKKDVCPTIKCCIATSEQCTDIDKKILEVGFGVNVVKEYGASELDFIAFNDKNGDWIISNEVVFIEIIDENNKPLKDGEVGRIILTSLHNKAMPFIRYEIGDLGSIQRSNGSRYDKLITLNGRLNDFAILPSGKKVPGFTLYYVSRQILEKSGIVKEYVIKQISISCFVFEIVSDKPILEKDKAIIVSTMEQYLEPGIKIEIKRVDKIDRQKSGKLKHFISLISN